MSVLFVLVICFLYGKGDVTSCMYVHVCVTVICMIVYHYTSYVCNVNLVIPCDLCQSIIVNRVCVELLHCWLPMFVTIVFAVVTLLHSAHSEKILLL